MAFQAFIDDAGTKGQGKVLILGGLFGTAEAMALVAERWEHELRAQVPFPIRYFKAYEAISLSDEFQYWRPERRNEKIRRLASILDRDDLTIVYSSVQLPSHRDLERYMSQRVFDANRQAYEQPYLLALLAVMLTVGMEMRQRQTDERVEVILDERASYRDDATHQYKLMRAQTPEWLKQYLPVEPLFRNDRDCIMLQAADLLMGHLRMTVEKTSQWPTLQWHKVRVSPFAKEYVATEISDMTAHQFAKDFGVSGVSNVNIANDVGDGS